MVVYGSGGPRVIGRNRKARDAAGLDAAPAAAWAARRSAVPWTLTGPSASQGLPVRRPNISRQGKQDTVPGSDEFGVPARASHPRPGRDGWDIL